MKKKSTLYFQKNRLLLVISFFQLSIMSTFSQSLQGVINNDKGEIIPDAVVYLLTGNKINNSQSVDTNGKFIFKQIDHGKYILSIKSIGYSTYYDTLSVTSDVDLGVLVINTMKTINLESVIVSGVKSMVERTIDKDIVNIENTYLSRLPTTLDMLNQLPELNITDGNISILGKNNVAIFVNGRLSNLLLKDIPINNISKVEIISNPSSKYEGNFEAIVNVILKKGITNGIQGQSFYTYERKSNNRHNIGTSIYYNDGIFNSSLNLSYENTISTLGNTSTEQFFFKSVPKYINKLDLNRIFSGYSMIFDFDIDLLLSKSRKITINGAWRPDYIPNEEFNQNDSFFGVDKPSADSSSSSNVKWCYYTRFANGGISYLNTSKSFTFESRFDVFWQDDSTRTNNNFIFNGFSNIANRMSINTIQFRTSTALVPSLNLSKNIGKNKIELGVKYYSIISSFNLDINSSGGNTYNVNPINSYTSTENIYAGYINYSGNGKKINYQIGLRSEYSPSVALYNGIEVNNNFFKILPSLALIYSINKSNTLNFSYSEKFNRVPYARQSPLFYYTSPFSAYEGNPLLNPQTLRSGQLKYVYNNYNATIYFNQYLNYLGLLPYIKGNTTILKYSNYEMINYGLIIGVPIKFTNKWNGQHNIKSYYQVSDGDIRGNKFNYGNWTYNININEKIKINESFSTAFLFNYTLPYYLGVTKIRTEPSLDLNFTKVIKKNAELSLYFRDLTGSFSRSYLSRDFDDVRVNSTIQRDTRGISITFKYKFNNGRKIEKTDRVEDDVKFRL